MVCAFRSSCSRESDVLHSIKVSLCFCCRLVAALFDFWNACSVAASATADSSVCVSGLDCATCLSSAVYAVCSAVRARSQLSTAAFFAFSSCVERLRCHSAAPPAASAITATAATDPMMIFLRLPLPPSEAACSGVPSSSPPSPPSISANATGALGSGAAVCVSLTVLAAVRAGRPCARICVRSAVVPPIAGIAVVARCAASAGVNSCVGSSSAVPTPAPHTGRSKPSPASVCPVCVGCAVRPVCAAGSSGVTAADFAFRRCFAGGCGGCAGGVCRGSSASPTDGNISVELSNDVRSSGCSSCAPSFPVSGNCRSDSLMWLIFSPPLRQWPAVRQSSMCAR